MKRMFFELDYGVSANVEYHEDTDAYDVSFLQKYDWLPSGYGFSIQSACLPCGGRNMDSVLKQSALPLDNAALAKLLNQQIKIWHDDWNAHRQPWDAESASE